MDIKLADYDVFNVIKKESEYYLIKNHISTLRMYLEDATKPLTVGEQIEVFLYVNHTKKIVATMKKPKIDQYHADWVNVVEVKFGLGVFVDVGLSKDMLVSKDDLPVLKRDWPMIGDTLFCLLRPGKNQITAKPLSRYKIPEYLKVEQPLELHQDTEAYVYYIADEGWVTFTKEGHEIFIYQKHSRNPLRLGEKVTVTITNVKDDLHYNGTTLKQKELMKDDDAVTVLNYIKAQGGSIKLTDKSDPTLIFETLNMSKAAFKRALGTLYKEKAVILTKEETRLNEE